MAFQLSPGVNVSEIDLTTIVPSVATSIGAFAGKFAWGPCEEIVTISDEVRLADRFSKPNSDNYEYWFSAANFLAYSNNLKVVRAANTDTKNATANATTGGVRIMNEDIYNSQFSGGSFTYGEFAAKYPGVLGNSLRVEMADANTFSGWDYATSFTDSPATSAYVASQGGVRDEVHVVVIDEDGKFTGTSGTILETFGFLSKAADAKTDDGSTNYYKNVLNDSSKYIYWTGHPVVANVVSSITANVNSTSPSGNVFVTFTGGQFTVAANARVSINSVSNLIQGVTVLNNGNYSNTTGLSATVSGSNAVLTLNLEKTSNNWGETSTTNFANLSSRVATSLSGGTDGTITNDDIIRAYDYFDNPDSVDISLIVSGPANQTIATHLIDNIADDRKDCVVFLSPEKADVVDNYGDEATDSIAYRNTLTSSSYAVIDCNWKYQYDKYNDVYRWVPLNGDIAGLAARTDRDRDPWYSPAGLNRGIIKNVIKLAWNPVKAERDDMYVKGINPVVTFPGEGTILFGDKTMLSRPSAFDRINVRRLFIVLEKSIARAARSSLFEFNDQFTRAQFVSLVEPFLRDVQGRRGITDFRVVCDETNNTGEVIDRNEFIGDIYIKPARSINFIQLNFVAVRTGVSFDEVVGKFG
jgi:phage tail sheath protein FI